jgi:hypothetical protein
MDSEIITQSETDLSIQAIRAEVLLLPTRIECPETVKGHELVFSHESGHITMALYFNWPVVFYNISNKLQWASEGYDTKKSSWSSTKLDDGEGTVLYVYPKSQKEKHKIVAAGGVAAKLTRFGHIGSSTDMQEGDRKNGNYRNIFEIQAIADPIADRFETDLSSLYRFTLNRVATGRGFDDINSLIKNGIRIEEVFIIAPA